MPARITRWKGHEDFIELIKNLSHKYPNIHGLIVGDEKKKNKYKAELKNKINELKLKKSITFVGHRNDIREVMSISKIVFSLSKEPEAFGRVSLESLSIGKPVIAYSHGGVKEQLVRLFPSGLIKVGSINEATKLAIKLLRKPPKTKKNNFFTLEKMLKTTLNIYKNRYVKKRV